MPYVLVNTASGGAFGTSADSSAFTLTAGNLVVVFLFTASSNSAAFNAPTDDAGNTWHHAASLAVSGSGGGFVGTCEVYYAFNALGKAGNIVHATWTGNLSGQVNVLQYSGVQTSSDPWDDVGATVGHSASPVSSASFTPTAAGELAVAGCLTNASGGTFTAGGSYAKELANTFNTDAEIEDLLAGVAAGAQTASMTFSNGGTGFLVVALFKPGGTTYTRQLNAVN
ncbi:MAG TPA: hypothetical protein VEU08_19965 [Vicinamibacterales bacterium]|nr:hypothetical protein [Vicinamibacterales bacterium]